jgi:magnesium chelatase subunit D
MRATEARARLVQALACAAITPGLRSILVFDATPQWLEVIAGLLERMLQKATGLAPLRTPFRATADEESLWGTLGLSWERRGAKLVWMRGPFEPEEREWRSRLVVIPDLARLELPAVRACVSLVGADVAHLERHGQSRSWRPELCWVAACSRSELGRVSPHLLDRFALRLDVAGLEPADPEEMLRCALRKEPIRLELPLQEVERYLHRDLLARALWHRPKVGAGALRRVLAYFPGERGPRAGARRELALARLADALARLRHYGAVSRWHVDAAAKLMGLLSPEARAAGARFGDTSLQEPLAPPPEPPPPELPPRQAVTLADTPASPARPGADTAIQTPDNPEVVPGGPLSPGPFSGDPYPEDSAPVEREPESLRPPPRRRTAGIGSRRGSIIGVAPARDLGDLSISSTLFEAAKYQVIRKKRRPREGGLLMSAADFRGYVRVAPPEHLLVLLVDFTATAGWDWGAVVLPYLRDAYVERAAVCVVQVGSAEEGKNELRARRVMSRSALAPQVYRALAAGRGRATPLAHGLELALETLRHALRHGRSTAARARLVVVSDGRGNVPLEASRRLEYPRVIHDEGVRDALDMAERVRALSRVEVVLLHPSPRFYPEMPSVLAAALGARMLAPQKET